VTGFFAGIISLWILGAALFTPVMRAAKYRSSVLEYMSTSFLFGIALGGYILFMYETLEIPFDFRNVMIATGISAFILLITFLARGVDNFHFRAGQMDKFSLFEKVLLAGIGIQLIWTVFLVIPVPVNAHDALANYALKAKMFFFSSGVPEGFFALPEAAVAHPDYPLLLPMVMTWLYQFMGFNDIIVNLVMPFIYAAFLMFFYSQVRKIFPRKISILAVFMLSTIPQLADYATVIHADLILTVLITSAFINFMLFLREKKHFYFIISSVLFGFSLWAKNEAMVFVAAYLLLVLACVVKQSNFRLREKITFAGTAILIIAVVAMPWFFVKASSCVSNSDMELTSMSLPRIMQNVKDIPIIFDMFQEEVFGPKKWNIFWILVFMAMVLKRKDLFRREVFYITSFLAVTAIGYFAGYMLTTGNNLYFYVNTTLSRFMLHFTGICLFYMFYLLKDDLRGVEWLN